MQFREVRSLIFPIASYSFEMTCYRRMLRIPYTSHRTNVSVLSFKNWICMKAKDSLNHLKADYTIFRRVVRRRSGIVNDTEWSWWQKKATKYAKLFNSSDKIVNRLHIIPNHEQCWRTRVMAEHRDRNPIMAPNHDSEEDPTIKMTKTNYASLFTYLSPFVINIQSFTTHVYSRQMPKSIGLSQIPKMDHIIPTSSDQFVVIAGMKTGSKYSGHMSVVSISVFTENLLLVNKSLRTQLMNYFIR